MLKNIELELRAEILKENFETILKRLKREGNLISKTKRLSVMFFGGCENNCFDVRVRITNGESEIAIKKRSPHSCNRTEFSQKIPNEQFIDMVKIISQFGFDSKVGERESLNFRFPDNITVSLVKAGNLSYLEIEKMADKTSQKEDKKKLEGLAKKLGVEIIHSKEKFDNFCERLSETVDWKFTSTESCYDKLKILLDK